MEIGQQGESVEDSILKNLSETRDLWRSQESNQNTKMLQPKSKVSNHDFNHHGSQNRSFGINWTSITGTSWNKYHIGTTPVPYQYHLERYLPRMVHSEFHKYLAFRI